MDKIKAAVLIELDEHQKEELEAAGKDMVEFVYVPEDMSREERLPLLKQAQIIFGQPGIREINQCEHLRWIQMSWAGTDVYTAREGFPRQLLQELGREPQPEEIAAEMNMPVERVREILKISQEPVSLETPIGEEEDSHLGDFIQDDNVPVPAEAAAFTLLKEQLVEVLGTLTEREQKVLRLRFGLDDGRARTLEEVGKEFNVTRERIRQIEAKALRKLRHPSRSRKLKDFLE